MIQFNPWKHHLGYIKSEIKKAVSTQFSPLDYLCDQNKTIKNNITDLYFGKLSIDQISDEIIKYLLSSSVLKKDKYSAWLNNMNDFAIIRLSDKSRWILRLSPDQKNYIHIHPAKYSPNTLRLKTFSLITAIIVNANAMISNHELFDLAMINHLRNKHLNLSPIKSVSRNKGIGKTILLINN